MSGIYLKITLQANKENVIHNEEKKLIIQNQLRTDTDVNISRQAVAITVFLVFKKLIRTWKISKMQIKLLEL